MKRDINKYSNSFYEPERNISSVEEILEKKISWEASNIH